MDFSLNLYLFHLGNGSTALDKFYRQLDSKLTWYLENIESTIILLQKEFNEKKDALDVSYAPILKSAHDNYDRQIQRLAENDHDGREIAHYTSGINEVESHIAYDLEELTLNFEDVKDLYNKSAIINLYALLESNTNKLCDVLRGITAKRIKYKDLAGRDYFKKGTTYFDLVIGLDITSLSSHTSKFEEIQFVRNKLIHNGGEFPDPLQQIEKIVDNSHGFSQLLKNHDGNNILIITDTRFIYPYHKTCRKFFQQLLWEINRKLDNYVLNSRFMTLFRYVYMAIEVSIKTNDLHGDIRLITGRIISNDQNQMQNCEFIIQISPSEIRVTAVENLLIGDPNPKLDNLLANFQSDISIAFDLIFQGFYLDKSNIEIKLTLKGI